MLKLIYKFLEIPTVYRVAMILLVPGSGRFMRPLYRNVFNRDVRRVLDVGCGPSPTTPEPPEGWMVGVDLNESYIKNYTGGFLDQSPELVLNPPANRRRLGFLSSADHLPFPDASFDEVRSKSFFHHLPTSQAVQTIREMIRCLRPGGRIVTFEDVWPRKAWTRPLAWLIRRFDRGVYMRNEMEVIQLFQEACGGPSTWERFTYSYNGLEYLCLQYVKK